MARTSLVSLSLLTALALVACRNDGTASAAVDAPTPTPAIAAAPAAGQPGALPGMAPAAPGDPPAPAFDLGKLPAVVARVNGQPISKQDLLDRAGSMRAQMERMGAPPPPPSEQFYRAMVDQLIGSRLLLADAKQRGMMPTAAEVEANLAQLKARNPEAFAKQLADQGITEQALKDDLTHNLAVQKLVSSEVTPAATATEAEARAFYQQHTDSMKRPPQVRVRHILVRAGQDATPAQRQTARQKAEGLLARLQGGADFATVARESSDDQSTRPDGGLLPWMGQGQTAPPFEQAAFALKAGAVSGVVETPFGYHLIRLEDRRPASTLPFEDARPQIEQWLSRQHARELLDKKVAALRQAAKVEVLF